MKSESERQALAKQQAEADAGRPGVASGPTTPSAAPATTPPGSKPAPAAKQPPSAAGFEHLGPNSTLADLLPYFTGPYATAARQTARSVKTRQADAVALLKQGHLLALPHLLEFDVDATPQLCQAYGEALTKAAQDLDPKTKPDDYVATAMALQEQIPNIQWLTGEHCDLDQPLSLLELNVRMIAEPRLAHFADLLAKARKTK
jgi:hypothetical protein